jgi:hypothetical protein
MRLALSEDFPDGLADVRHRWRFVDQFEGHLVLDLREAYRAQNARRGER